MKKLIFLSFFSTIMCAQTYAHPSDDEQQKMALIIYAPATMEPGMQDMTAVTIWGPSRDKRYCLSGGFSSDFRNEGYLGVKGIFDYKMWPRVTVGLEAGAYANNTSFRGKRTLDSGVRASYQWIPFDRVWRRKPWSFYTGISAGALLGPGDKSFKEVEPYLDIHAGARYRIGNQWMLFSEISTRTATLGLSLKF